MFKKIILFGLMTLGLVNVTEAQVVPQNPNATQYTVTPTGATNSATLAALTAQQGVLVDTFKATADTDDTASFNRAMTACVPILLKARTYTVNNFNSGTSCSPFIMRGIKGASIIQKDANGTLFNIKSAIVYVDGVTFDANGTVYSSDNSWNVLINQGGQTIDIEHSTFKNNVGSIGSGLAILSTGPSAGGSFILNGIEVTNNVFNPLYLGSVSNGIVINSYIHDNSTTGAYASAYGTASSTNYLTNVTFNNNIFLRNTGSGLGIGGCTGNNCTTTPYPATNILIENNQFHDNSAYHLSVQADHVSVIGNKFTSTSTFTANNPSGAIDCNATYPFIENNVVNLNSTYIYGIDCGGSVQADIRGNNVTMPAGSLIDAGGTSNSVVENNTLNMAGSAYTIGMAVLPVESGSGGAFPNITSNLIIRNNHFIMSSTSANGITVYGNAGGYNVSGTTALPVQILNNDFQTSGTGTGSYQDIHYFGLGGSVRIQNNIHNGNYYVFVDPNTNGDVIFDDVYDEVIGSTATTAVRSFITTDINTYNAGGSVLYAYPTSFGSNYTSATVLTLGTCTGGSGFAATPAIVNGQIYGVIISNNGSGYSTGCTLTASDTGGGSGAVFAVGQTLNLPAKKKFRWVSAGNTLKPSGGYIAITGMNSYLPTNNNQIVDLEALSTGTYWDLAGYEMPAYAPTISSGFGTSPSIVSNFGVISFSINVGTGGTASSGVISFAGLGSGAKTGWACDFQDVTTPASYISRQTASSTTTVTVTNYSTSSLGTATAWPASEILEASCKPN